MSYHRHNARRRALRRIFDAGYACIDGQSTLTLPIEKWNALTVNVSLDSASYNFDRGVAAAHEAMWDFRWHLESLKAKQK